MRSIWICVILAFTALLVRVDADGVATGCCLEVSCCSEGEFCCDDCASSCTCSVGGVCPGDDRRSGEAVSKESYLRLFEQFKKDFDRKYDSKREEQRRFIIFVQNMQRIESLRRMDPEGHAEGHFPATQFSDRTLKEFARAHNIVM